MKPGTITRAEILLLRELKILEWKIKTKQIDGPEAKRQGHLLLERGFETNIREVEEEASEKDLGDVNRDDSELQQRLTKSKRDWDRIVDDLLAI